jgi:hypothetical protein
MLAALTIIHVLISLVGIATGFVVLFGLIGGKRLDRLTSWFLATTVATSVTGYFFPVHQIMPSHIVGAISLVVLAFAIYARYSRGMAGGWRTTYVVGATLALYLNVFVLVVQLFLKVPALKALAPTQQEPPFAIAQGIVFALFVGLGIAAVRKFRLEPLPIVAAASR